MGTRLATLMGVTLLCVAPVALGASDAGDAHHDSSEGWWVLVRHALNLAFLAFIVGRYAVPFLREFMEQRSREVRDQIEASQRALEAAQQEIDALRGQLARADDEARELLEQVAEAAEGERARSLTRTEESAQRIREDARRIADQEVERARHVLQAEAAQLAIELAAGLLRERLTEEDDRRLFGEFTEHVGNAT